MEAAPTLDQWIQSLTAGEVAPSSSQLANSIKQYYYYSDQSTPEEYNIDDRIKELFRVSNIGDLREIFSSLFPETHKGIIDARSTSTRVKDIIKFQAKTNKNRINFTFIDKLITIMNLLRERQQQRQQQQQEQCGDSDESSCVLQGGRRRRQMKKKSKRVKVKRSTRRRSSKRHSHYKK